MVFNYLLPAIKDLPRKYSEACKATKDYGNSFNGKKR